MLINILWPPLDANQYGGRVRRTGSIFSCCKGLWDVFLPKPITTKHQSVFWLVSQSRRMSAICVGSCRCISLAAACADPVISAMSFLSGHNLDARKSAALRRIFSRVIAHAVLLVLHFLILHFSVDPFYGELGL